MTIYTAGYEGLTIDAFIARLQQAELEGSLQARHLPVKIEKIADLFNAVA